ncbi:hypothetical protein RQP46_008274 [Phenoliferia psychrophenolica]
MSMIDSHGITLDGILLSNPTSADPFAFLRVAFHNDLTYLSGSPYGMPPIAALLQTARLKGPEAAGQGGRRAAFAEAISPRLINLYFVIVLFTAPVAMASITVGATIKFNQGVHAYNLLELALQSAQAANNGAPGGATEVLAAIPQAEAWLRVMAQSFFSQIAYLRKSVHRERGISSESHLSAVTFESTISADQERKTALISILRTVIATSVSLCLCMFVYMSLCVVGQDSGFTTAVFHIYKGTKAHLYAVLFVFTVSGRDFPSL